MLETLLITIIILSLAGVGYILYKIIPNKIYKYIANKLF